LVTISQNIKFGTCECLESQSHLNIALNNMFKIYPVGYSHMKRIDMLGNLEDHKKNYIRKCMDQHLCKKWICPWNQALHPYHQRRC